MDRATRYLRNRVTRLPDRCHEYTKLKAIRKFKILYWSYGKRYINRTPKREATMTFLKSASTDMQNSKAVRKLCRELSLTVETRGRYASI